MVLGAVLIVGAAFFLAHGTEAMEAVGVPLVVALFIGLIIAVIGEGDHRRKR